MSLFRSEMLPFHPPRYASRIGEGLARYGRPRASSAGIRDAQALDARTHDGQQAHDAVAPAGRVPGDASCASATATADAAVALAA